MFPHIVWGAMVDKKKPDRYEILGSLIDFIGATMIFYAPRYTYISILLVRMI